ncbi:hypothetical protein MATL_G00167340 [Megalops atlanticus]|uniref:RBR-type E3 ubiquitin transferase n=1 Tax=Megalops atlanticus TaxID=7932 RepID=A0A9D3PN70_MEGAT|nr:hypothetical protein MATL_G00167340 [Megalops atlanticus]
MSVSQIQTQCPRCHQQGVKPSGGQRAKCVSCSKDLGRVYRYCYACKRQWPRGRTRENSCTLPGCEIRAALLSSETITNPLSCVHGCPFFRACPCCKALLTHTGQGCPNIMCPHCGLEFCFRCLRRDCLIDPCPVVNNSESLKALVEDHTKAKGQ